MKFIDLNVPKFHKSATDVANSRITAFYIVAYALTLVGIGYAYTLYHSSLSLQDNNNKLSTI